MLQSMEGFGQYDTNETPKSPKEQEESPSKTSSAPYNPMSNLIIANALKNNFTQDREGEEKSR